jgi:hypothetical protein
LEKKSHAEAPRRKENLASFAPLRETPNTAESSFALVKRGLMGICCAVSIFTDTLSGSISGGTVGR